MEKHISNLHNNAMNVAVLGASNKPERYSFKAVRMLREKGHTPFPVHPALTEVDGLPVSPSLRASSRAGGHGHGLSVAPQPGAHRGRTAEQRCAPLHFQSRH